MKKLCCFIALLCIFVSCTHTEKAKDTPSPVSQSLDIASPVSASVEQEKKIEIIKPKELYSFSLREADVKDVLRAIAKQTNYNMVIEPDVEGECTVDLKDVTLEKALEYIVEPLEFSYKIEGRTAYVSKPKLETKIFPINYLALRKTGFSTVFGNTGGTSTGGGAAPTGGTSTTSGTGAAGAGASGSTVILRSETDSDIWKILEENVKKLNSKEGTVFVNNQANMVVVTDYPKNVKSVVRFLEGIEAIVHRQVMIEAKIVEVQLNDGYKEGINWQLLNGKLWDYTINVGQQLRSPIVLPGGAQTATDSPFFAFFVGGQHLDINNTFVELLKTQGTINIVSSPKIVTMNNQRAVIKVAKQDVYFDVQQSTGSGAATPTVTYTPRFINVGLILDVIPQIDDIGNIILNIHPMLTNKVSEVLQPINTGVGPTTYTSVPVLDVRETDTMVKMKDGDTVIIGGLLQDYKKNDVKGIPGLMSIPLFGKLFSYTEETSTKVELVVLLTPRIIYSGDRK
ncbi:MAG: secretin N-terminal domain-containing protein [Proteobacteria bacterium]|nr:secretin N-terminal domain-containing protein [Pseudomonadota bacterium]